MNVLSGTNTDCWDGGRLSYQGTHSTTDDGTACVNWSVHLDEWEGYGVDTLLEEEGDHNYCRNPDKKGTGKTWCYTTSLNPYYWWDYCDVERCNRDQFDFYKL